MIEYQYLLELSPRGLLHEKMHRAIQVARERLEELELLNLEARELEQRIAENVGKLLEGE